MLRSWTARAFNAFWPKVKVLNLFDDLINGEMTLLHTVDLDCMPNLKTVGLRHQSKLHSRSLPNRYGADSDDDDDED